MSGGQIKYDQTWVTEDEQFGCDNILHHTLLYIRYRFGQGENLFVQNMWKEPPRRYCHITN
jgi:hypothetical protein